MHRYATPLGIFLLLLVLLGIGLTLNPRTVPSPLIDKPIPAFELIGLKDPGQRLSHETLRGQVSLLNVWATWCVPCRQEHPVLVGIAARGEATIYGINYKDDRRQALAWLRELGDPYRMNGYDATGRAGIELGVYGLPETFIIDSTGKIIYKHIGPISESTWNQTLLPKIKALQASGG